MLQRHARALRNARRSYAAHVASVKSLRIDLRHLKDDLKDAERLHKLAHSQAVKDELEIQIDQLEDEIADTTDELEWEKEEAEGDLQDVADIKQEIADIKQEIADTK